MAGGLRCSRAGEEAPTGPRNPPPHGPWVVEPHRKQHCSLTSCPLGLQERPTSRRAWKSVILNLKKFLGPDPEYPVADASAATLFRAKTALSLPIIIRVSVLSLSRNKSISGEHRTSRTRTLATA
jgi:hypothetical protein